MLVLKRRRGESIIINDRIRIIVTSTSDGGCQLAIDAPESDRIRRAELPPFEDSIVQQTASALSVAQ